jgi:argininosuccinate synthase
MHEIQFKQIVDQQWSWLTYAGLWHDPLRADLDKFIDATQTRVTGKVKLKLQNGSLQVVGRKSLYSLYKNDLATFGAGSKFDQGLARGFVELWGLQSIIAKAVANETGNMQNSKRD